MPRSLPQVNKAPRGEAGDFEEIEVPNKLREKVGPGFGANPAAIERADKVVETMKKAYENRLDIELDNVTKLFNSMLTSGEFDLDRLHDQVHEIRGEAGTFGYELVSDIGKLLCEFLSRIETVSVTDARAIKTHLKAMRTVAQQQITGSGPEVARQIVSGLSAIVEKSRAEK